MHLILNLVSTSHALLSDPLLANRRYYWGLHLGLGERNARCIWLRVGNIPTPFCPPKMVSLKRICQSLNSAPETDEAMGLKGVSITHPYLYLKECAGPNFGHVGAYARMPRFYTWQRG